GPSMRMRLTTTLGGVKRGSRCWNAPRQCWRTFSTRSGPVADRPVVLTPDELEAIAAWFDDYAPAMYTTAGLAKGHTLRLLSHAAAQAAALREAEARATSLRDRNDALAHFQEEIIAKATEVGLAELRAALHAAEQENERLRSALTNLVASHD